jgi:hypothetical protein
MTPLQKGQNRVFETGSLLNIRSSFEKNSGFFIKPLDNSLMGRGWQ